ncbi:MAG: hypothetical protein QM756_29870 [Polyangiaceae bacterium]
MDIRPELQIASMIRAMQDIVLPAVDPANRLAQEQARLVIATLGLVAQRLPLAYRYDRDELTRYVALADDLLSCLPSPARAHVEVCLALDAAAAHGRDLLQRAGADPAELAQSSMALRSQVGALVEWARASAGADAYHALSVTLLDAARIELERERALVVAMGFEPDPSAMPPPVERQLG